VNGEWALDASAADIIFVHNTLGSQGRIRLQEAQTAVVTGNRFGRVEQEAITLVPQSLLQMEHRIQVSGNVFAVAR
jgi:hypothetical protein